MMKLKKVKYLTPKLALECILGTLAILRMCAIIDSRADMSEEWIAMAKFE
jgi:hypothetical protein